MGYVVDAFDEPDYDNLPFLMNGEHQKISKGQYSMFTDGMIGCFSGMQAIPQPCIKALGAQKSKKYKSKSLHIAEQQELIRIEQEKQKQIEEEKRKADEAAAALMKEQQEQAQSMAQFQNQQQFDQSQTSQSQASSSSSFNEQFNMDMMTSESSEQSISEEKQQVEAQISQESKTLSILQEKWQESPNSVTLQQQVIEQKIQLNQNYAKEAEINLAQNVIAEFKAGAQINEIEKETLKDVSDQSFKLASAPHIQSQRISNYENHNKFDYSSCLDVKTIEQRDSICQNKFEGKQFLLTLCMSDEFCHACCDNALDKIHKIEKHQCINKCQVTNPKSIHRKMDLCSSRENNQSIYDYCEKTLCDQIQIDRCNNNMCKLCCTVSDKFTNNKLQQDDIEYCFSKCDDAYILRNGN